MKVIKSQAGQYKIPLLMVGTRSLFNLAMISGTVSPCSPALYEKKTELIIGPYTACPRNIFFNVFTTSFFGNTFEIKLNQRWRVGPEISNP